MHTTYTTRTWNAVAEFERGIYSMNNAIHDGETDRPMQFLRTLLQQWYYEEMYTLEFDVRLDGFHERGSRGENYGGRDIRVIENAYLIVGDGEKAPAIPVTDPDMLAEIADFYEADICDRIAEELF